MIYQLIKYAVSHNLVVEPGFEKESARWAIQLDNKGNYLGILELGDTSAQRNPGQFFERCPKLPSNIMQGGGKSHFLIESAEVVVLAGIEKKNATQQAKVMSKNTYYRDLLNEAGDAVPEMRLCAAVLENEETMQQIRNGLAEHNAKDTDKVTFAILGRTPTYLVEDELWYSWWREKRHSIIDDGEKKAKTTVSLQMRSFADGALTTAKPTHDKINGLYGVGGSSMGSSLISFDKEAFTSFGLEQSANAAMSVESEAAYRAALNTLISKSVRVAGTRIAYWFKEKIQDDDDPIPFLQEPPERQELAALAGIKSLLESLKQGQRPELANNIYYALTLAGNAGRVMVYDWIEGRFENLVENVVKWFDDLAIVDVATGDLLKPPRYENVITCVLPVRKPKQDYNDWIKPVSSFRITFWKSALTSCQIPRNAFEKAVILARNIIFKLNPKDKEYLSWLGHWRIEMALIKAYHIRKGDTFMQPYLNEDHPSAAYQCGRLMALLADLQYAALGDVGAGVIQRYYAAASTTPGLVLGRLVRLAQSHVGKLIKDNKNRAYWFDQQIATVHGKVKDFIPSTLSLSEQSLFALGYYQQKAKQ